MSFFCVSDIYEKFLILVKLYLCTITYVCFKEYYYIAVNLQK